MVRDYTNIDAYLDELQQDVYRQPSDKLHLSLMESAIHWGVGNNIKSVLDVGCGEGAARNFFIEKGISWIGVALGEETEEALFMDMSFLEFGSDSFDLIFARHVLEHSPMPLLTLMEWHRVARCQLLLILPNPEYWGYIGRNHYSVMPFSQARWLLRRAGWEVINSKIIELEFWFLANKRERISYEGYVPAPLDEAVFREDKEYEEMSNEDRCSLH